MCSLLLKTAGCGDDGGGNGAGTGTSTDSSSGDGDGGSGTTTSEDDGDTTTGDTGSTGTDTSTTTPEPECGNGIVEADEECDDGNDEALDGCENDCTSSSGLEIWSGDQDGPAHGDDWIQAVAASPDDTVVFAGHQTVENEAANIWLCKIETSGPAVWSVIEDVGAPLGADSPDYLSAVAVDGDGNIATAGSMRINEGTGDWDIWIGGFDADGNEVWADAYAGSAVAGDYARGVAFDSDGNVIVVGVTATAAQGNDAWIRKLDGQGVVQWTNTENGPASGDDEYADVATDGTTIITVGSQSADTGHIEARITAYDTDWTELWSVYEASEEAGDMHGRGVAVDQDGNVIVTGTVFSGTSDFDVWIAKYDSGGQPIWSTTWDGSEADRDAGMDVVAGESGDLFIAGLSVVPNEQENILAGSWDTDGNERWLDTLDGEASQNDSATGVALDANGFVYVVGGVTVTDEGTNGWLRKYYP